MTAAIRTYGLCRDYGPVRAVAGLCALTAAILAFRRLDIH